MARKANTRPGGGVPRAARPPAGRRGRRAGRCPGAAPSLLVDSPAVTTAALLARLGAATLLAALAPAAALAQQPTLAELGVPPRAEFEHATGSFAVRFGALPEGARPAAIVARLRGETSPAPISDPPVALALDLHHELFFVHVPDGYRRDTPYGLLVWISPTDFGGTVRPDPRAPGGAALDLDRRPPLRQRARAPRPPRPGARRRDRGAEVVDDRPERIVVAGYSAAADREPARPSLARAVPRRPLRHGLQLVPAVPVPGEPGRIWTASYAEPPKAALALARRQPLVFLTGERDFNRAQTVATEAAARRERFRRTTLVEVPGIDHTGAVPIEAWRAALAALDEERHDGRD